MERRSVIVKAGIVIFLHALVGWALCGATMGIGMGLMSMQATLVVHAVLAPVFFIALSLLYFRRFNFTTPLQTALIFLLFIMAVDLIVVALLIQRSLEMFTSPLGTWIPFALIFAATYCTGLILTRQGRWRDSDKSTVAPSNVRR
jgi:hypothetical protein